MTGAHYWFLNVSPGKTVIRIRALNFSGNIHNVTIHLYDSAKTWHQDIQLNEQKSDTHFDGSPKTPMKLIVEISPPGSGQLFGNLVRSGADYEIEATGAVRFAAAPTGDPICRVYQDLNDPGHGMLKFLPNGTIACSDGTSGSWKVFDAQSHLYLVTFVDRKFTVKHVLGVGLMDTVNGIQTFKELR